MSPPPQAVAGRSRRVLGLLHASEDTIAALPLAAMVLLPLAEIVVRPFFAGGIPGSIPFVQHLTLWVGFLGAALAARENKLIALATASFIPEGSVRRATQDIRGHGRRRGRGVAGLVGGRRRRHRDGDRG